MKSLDLFKHKTAVGLRYADLDTYGHVNNKHYLGFLEEARIKYYRDVMGMEANVMDFGAVVARVEINYLAPIQYEDNIEVWSRCSKIGNKSYDIEAVILRNENDKIVPVAEAVVTLVSYNLKTGKAVSNPEKAILAIKKFEGEDLFA